MCIGTAWEFSLWEVSVLFAVPAKCRFTLAGIKCSSKRLTAGSCCFRYWHVCIVIAHLLTC